MTRTAIFFRFLLTVVLTAILATAMSTQFVLSGLISVGASVPLADRIDMTLFDIVGMGPLYAVFILIGLGIAFFVASWAARATSFNRMLVFTVAGMITMLVMLVAMEQVFFGVPLIPGARSVSGLIAQVLVGGLAGYLYARLTGISQSDDTATAAAA